MSAWVVQGSNRTKSMGLDGQSSPADPVAGEIEQGRVLVIANHLLTAQAVVMALTQRRYNARAIVPTPAVEVEDLGTWRPGLALLDIDTMDRRVVVACIRACAEAGIPIAIVTGDPDVLLGGAVLQAWAISVIDKTAPLAHLFAVVSGILAGDEVAVASARRREARRQSRSTPFEILTHREKYVLSQLMDGHRAEAIARGSFVSISTVRSQIKAILQKLGVNSQLAAASLARQAGWTFTASDDRTNRQLEELQLRAPA
jgi:two-component system, NarL family, nitrate/nitrite response regulator NarL